MPDEQRIPPDDPEAQAEWAVLNLLIDPRTTNAPGP